jgi:hypothetical protein
MEDCDTRKSDRPIVINELMFGLVHKTISAKINKYKDSIIMGAWFITGTNEIEPKQPSSLFFLLYY